MMLLCISWSISVAEWVDGLPVLMWVVLLGGLLGILLAKSRMPRLAAHLLSGMVGLSWGAWLTSRILVAEMHLPGAEALLELDWRLQTWLSDLVTRGESEIAHVLLFILCLLLWLLAYVSACAVFRWQRPWWAVILCSAAMLVNVTSAPSHQTWFLLSFLLLALLLIVRTSLASYEQEWRKGHVHYSPEVVAGFLRAGLTVAVLALSLAWIVPEAVTSNRFQDVWTKVRTPWQRVQERWEEAFQDLNYREAPPTVLVSRAMTFGGPVNLTDRPIMDIEASGGRYWRGHTYDTYLGWGWLNTDETTLTLEADSGDLLPQPAYAARTVLTQTVTLRQDLGMGQALTTAGDPLRMSVPVQAVVSEITPTVTVDTSDPGSLSGPTLSGASLLYSPNGLPAGAEYEARSSVTAVSAESLRQAGTDYPEWVLARYLQLPESLPSRVRRLAEEITAGLSAPYDMVVAVEAYLRKIPYSQEIQGPEPDQDGVDYFLFEEKSGYCSYYASSMVVLLRAAGVPSRYVEGYSKSQPVRGVYHIVEKDGHAWPEVFYPGYGWAEFEPTASQALTSRSPAVSTTAQAARPGIDRQLPQSDDLEDPYLREQGFGPPPTAPRVPLWQRVPEWVWAALGFALVGSAVAAWLILRQRRKLRQLTRVERVYYRLNRGVRQMLRIRPLEYQTPHEYAGMVGSAVPAGRAAVSSIAEAYVAERFGAKEGEAENAEAAWRDLRPAILRRWIEIGTDGARRTWRRVLPFGRRTTPRESPAAAD